MQYATTSIEKASQVETFERFVDLNRSVDRDHGSETDWLARHSHVCGLVHRFGPPGLREVSKYIYSRIVDDRNIRLAYDIMAIRDGDSLEADGFTLKRIPAHFRFQKAVKAEIDSGRYRYGKRRSTRIRKSSGIGQRPIRQSTEWDAVVDRSIWQVIEPLLDPTLSDYSFGGRPDVRLFDALRAAEKFARAGRKTWVCVKIADPFETLPQGPLLRLLMAAMPVCPAEEIKQHRRNQEISEDLHSLLGKIIRTPSRVGYRRYAETSELFMNLFFREFVDRPWRRQSAELPLLHHIDSVLIPCLSLHEASSALRRLSKLLGAAGWRLKEPEAGDKQIIDLGNGESANWCGARVYGRGKNLTALFL